MPPLVYLLAAHGLGRVPPGPAGPGGLRLPGWPVWALVVATLFLLGFRIGLNLQEERKVIDVGYAGVIGADRILDGRAPYGAMPVEDGLRACGRADADGRDPGAHPVQRPLRGRQPPR